MSVNVESYMIDAEDSSPAWTNANPPAVVTARAIAALPAKAIGAATIGVLTSTRYVLAYVY